MVVGRGRGLRVLFSHFKESIYTYFLMRAMGETWKHFKSGHIVINVYFLIT